MEGRMLDMIHSTLKTEVHRADALLRLSAKHRATSLMQDNFEALRVTVGDLPKATDAEMKLLVGPYNCAAKKFQTSRFCLFPEGV